MPVAKSRNTIHIIADGVSLGLFVALRNFDPRHELEKFMVETGKTGDIPCDEFIVSLLNKRLIVQNECLVLSLGKGGTCDLTQTVTQT